MLWGARDYRKINSECLRGRGKRGIKIIKKKCPRDISIPGA
jgi:hypothetical protein